jgi:membrane protein
LSYSKDESPAPAAAHSLRAARVAARTVPARVAVVGRRLVRQSLDDDVAGLAAELAFRFFLAMFPFAIFLAAVGGLAAANLGIENPARQIVNSLGDVLPNGADTLIQSQLQQIVNHSASAALTSGSALIALFLATGGMNAIIKAMNRVYDVPEARPFWRRYPLALTLTLIAGAGLLAAFVLYGPIRYLAPQIAEALGAGQATPGIVTLLSIAGAMLLVTLAALLVYRIAPNIKLPVRTLLPGAIVAALGWLATTFGLDFYIVNFGSYANTYGALAGVAILLIWFYASALVFLVAGELNEVIHAVNEPSDLRRRRLASEEAMSSVNQRTP